MPSIVPITHTPPSEQNNGVIKFTNCLLVKGNDLIREDLWTSSVSGKILNGQEIMYGDRTAPDYTIDLGGRIISPGFIDTQFNGGYGVDFSDIPEEGEIAYGKGVLMVNKKLIERGVTSYMPTITSQRPEVYHKGLPFLGPSGSLRDSTYGSESLGAHCEGPFMSPTKNGIHNLAVLRTAPNGISDMEACYGASNLTSPSPIRLITLAPELPGALSCITSLKQRGIITSIGHSEASFEEATEALHAGASTITHLFNAMKPLHHRNPGIFGVLGTPPSSSTTPPKPYFGIIADGIHLHPTSIKIAWHAHPSGLILVTDAMKLAGMPDGTYEWTNGSRIKKEGHLLTLEENGRIAGSSIELVECVNNFLNWTGASVPEAVKTVTETPARMLGISDRKGVLKEGADADLLVLNLQEENGGRRLVIDQVWKFGEKVFGKDAAGKV